MPLVWRYLLREYLKVFALAVATFITLLFVSRLHQLAQFALIGSWREVFLFAIYLIPYVLPLALPLASLLASYLIVVKLCQHGELSALRSLGLSTKRALTPLLLAAALLGVVNFAIASEVATHFHYLQKKMQREQVRLTPYQLLQVGAEHGRTPSYVDMRKGRSGGSGMVVAFKGGDGQLNLLTCDSVRFDGADFEARGLDWIAKRDDQFLLEHVEKTSLSTDQLTGLIRPPLLSPKGSHLGLRELLLTAGAPQEIARRLTLAVSAVTLTLLGAACALQFPRQNRRGPLIALLCLSTLFLVTFLAAPLVKGPGPYLLYLLPQLLIVNTSLQRLRAIDLGVCRG